MPCPLGDLVRLQSILFALVIACCARAGADESRDPWTAAVDWPRLGAAFSAFVDYPSPENARAVSALLPEKHAAMGVDGSAAATNIIYEGLPMLERQVEARVPEAVQLGFDLYSVADGALWEDLTVVLNKLVRIDPKLFVTQLAQRPMKLKRPHGLLISAGGPYVDRQRAYCFEIEARAKAIETVKKPALQAARDRSLAILEEARSECRRLGERSDTRH